MKPDDVANVNPLLLPIRQGAERDTWLGAVTDQDRQELSTTTVKLQRWMLAEIDLLAQYLPAGYHGFRSNVIRHAVYNLLEAWKNSEGTPPDMVTRLADVLDFARNVRESQRTLEVRQEFGDTLRGYERSLVEGLETSDWGLIERTLSILQRVIDGTPDPHWQGYVQHLVAQSPIVRKAVSELYDVRGGNGEAGDWQRWLEGLG